jgi:hypothetical protein
MLPVALVGIPAREDASGAAERLVELPIPRGVDAEGRSINMDRLRIAVSSLLFTGIMGARKRGEC